jgi:HEAT repeat protein
VSLLDDSSYAVIKAAAVALGSANAPDSYESLVKLLNRTSWRDNIRASALSGLSELKDKRSLAVGLKYAERGNNTQVRAAALRLLGRVGGDSSEAFTVVATTASNAFAEGNTTLATAAGEALVSLGDPKGVEVLERIGRGALTERLKPRVAEYVESLRKSISASGRSTTQHP